MPAGRQTERGGVFQSGREWERINSSAGLINIVAEKSEAKLNLTETSSKAAVKLLVKQLEMNEQLLFTLSNNVKTIKNKLYKLYKVKSKKYNHWLLKSDDAVFFTL